MNGNLGRTLYMYKIKNYVKNECAKMVKCRVINGYNKYTTSQVKQTLGNIQYKTAT